MIAKVKVVRRPRSKRSRSRTGEAKTLLFRLRRLDSPHGVSAQTLRKLAEVLDMPETQVIHEALRKLADDFIPAYERDNGPVSDRMLEALKARVPQGQFKSVASRLF
jgi:hypothetical protein